MTEQSFQEKISSILKLWEEHKCEKFPKIMSGKELDVIELAVLEADMAGCIDAFLKRNNKYTLDISRTTILKNCYRDLSKASAKLSGVPKNYFQRLETLALLIMEILKKGEE